MDEAGTRRDALVNELKQSKSLTDERVEAALRAVPRHLFLPDLPLEEVYADKAIPTKLQDGMPISSSSQPAIMAIMLEQLGLGRGQRVLEIGAGTGYNAALMGYLVGAEGHVTTVDIDEDIVARARENLARAGTNNVAVVRADGGFGYSPNAPYDAVIATVGVWDLSPHWIDQLKEKGRLVAPLWFNTLQFSIAFEKRGGKLVSASLRPCGFMRLRGAFAGPESFISIDGITVGAEDAGQLNAGALHALLNSPGERPRTVQPPADRGFMGYLALTGEPLLTLFAEEKEKYGFGYAVGLQPRAESLMLFIPGQNDSGGMGWQVRVYGTDAAVIHLNGILAHWQERGEPDLARATITAAPIGALEPDPNSFHIRKRWMEYEIDF